MGSDFAGALSWGVIDFGAAPVLSSPLLEELVLLPVLDFPQSHESLLELSSSLSLSSQPDDEVLEDDDEVDDEEEVDDEVLEDDEEVDDELLLVDEEELEEELVELEPQLSPLVSLLVGLSVPVDEVPPQPSSATGASSPVSS